MAHLRFPNVTGGSPTEQLDKLRRYLYQLVQELNYTLDTIESTAGGKTEDRRETGTIQFTPCRDVLAFADSCPIGLTPFISDTGATNVPTYCRGTPGLIFRMGEGRIYIYAICKANGVVAYCSKNSSGWMAWQYMATQS